MQITFNLSDVFQPDSSSVENAYVLRALLDCLVNANLAYLHYHTVGPLYRSGVVYGRTLEWERIPDVIERGHGDCKSLTAWRIAELIKTGVQATPVFRWRQRNNGVKDFHILHQTLTGFEDASRLLGMGKDEWAFFRSSS